jgi:hypothetical protein
VPVRQKDGDDGDVYRVLVQQMQTMDPSSVKQHVCQNCAMMVQVQVREMMLVVAVSSVQHSAQMQDFEHVSMTIQVLAVTLYYYRH